MKIAVMGAGFVGLSNALLLSSKCEVVAFDIDSQKIEMIKAKKSPFKDAEIEKALPNATNLTATTEIKEACAGAKFIIIATPTNYDENTNSFDTSSIQTAISNIRAHNTNATIIIKSTIPIGFTKILRKKFDEKILFSPEFLREGRALYDNLYPSRIVIGDTSTPCKEAKEFGALLKECALNDPEVLYLNLEEAESVKLFSNTYLAMRVAFFNELDSFALKNGLDSAQIIRGVGLDSRIGEFYNNPSFGYGGYCLPKDSKQMLANFLDSNTPNALVGAIVESNFVRKKFMAEQILKCSPKCVGIYSLAMKKNSDNFRSAAILDIIKLLKEKTKVIIFDPTIKESEFLNCEIERDFGVFKNITDVIVANRIDENLIDVREKVFSRDIFGGDA